MKKRIIAIGLCAVMAMSMTACGKDGKKSSSGNVKNTTNSTDSTSKVDNSEVSMSGTKYSAKVVLPDYEKYTVAESLAVVSDEDLEKYDYNLLSANTADTTNVGKIEGQVKEGIVVNIDYEGTMDGVAFDGGTAQGYNLAIGSGNFIEGFESGLVGVSTGETVVLNLKWPEGYTLPDAEGNSQDVSGQDVTFTVKVNYILGLTDQYIADNQQMVQYYLYRYFSNPAKVSTIDEYREIVKKGIQTQNIINVLFKKITEETTVTRDETELRAYIDDLEASYQEYATMYETDLATIISYYTGYSTIEEYEEYLKGIYDNLATMMAVANNEKIVITEEEYEEVVNSMLYISNGEYADIASFENDYPKQDTVDDIIYGNVYYALASKATLVPDDEAMIKPASTTENAETAEATE